MQRYQALPPTPPSSLSRNAVAAPADMQQMHHFVLENHFAQTKNLASLERKLEKNGEDLGGVVETVGRDMRVLQSQIETLKQQVEAHRLQQVDPEGSFTSGLRAQQDVTPTDEFLRNFSKEKIAEAYLDEAEDYEKTAAKLREQADSLIAGVSSRKPVKPKLLDAPNGISEHDHTDFACCGSGFASIAEMLDHVDKAHGFHPQDVKENEAKIDVQATMNGAHDGSETPTHVPPRRVKKENEQQNHAVDIKAPVEDGKATARPEQTENQPQSLTNGDITPTGQLCETLKKSIPTDLKETATTITKWQPLAVRQMPTREPINTSFNISTFSASFLTSLFGGSEWSPGFIFTPTNKMLPSKSYWLLDAEHEPFLPSEPGQHGAKLTAFFNETLCDVGAGPDEENYLKVPVFVKAKGEEEYVYFGNYSQSRFSDKLDYDTLMSHVPASVREYWASTLSSPDRPAWVTKALMHHFWPPPSYTGPVPTDSRENTEATEATEAGSTTFTLEKRVQRALQQYAEELKNWSCEAEMKVSHLSAENLMAAFGNADADAEPGLRLWWEYLGCVGYEQDFYDLLVTLKHDERLQVQSSAKTKLAPEKEAKMPGTTRTNVSGKIVKPPGSIETVQPVPAPAPALSKQPATTGTKLHTRGTKPWEKTETKPTTNNDTKPIPNGDMDVAKQLQRDYKKNYAAPAKRGGGNGAFVPPHERRGR